MRVAVVGATGNSGTAVLEHLASRQEITSILGVARRLPDTQTEPYSYAGWATADVQFPEVHQQLVELFDDVDAVVHLAWLIQPNSKRELLRRVNVDGTHHVLQAAASAGVQRIAVASSVGAYSPVDDDELRDESWPTGGIPGSHYSEDKAAQERVLDDFEAVHPEVALARLRPGLIFQAGAGSEIQRYFAGRFAPVQALNAFRPPKVPMPSGIRSQAVHAKDVAAAYAEAVIRGAHGAFNIAADDVLDGETIAAVVARRKTGRASVSLPMAPVRPLVKALHRSRVLPMDEGWLDMATSVPLLDTTRAKTELDWAPTVSGAEALSELIDAMSSGEGRSSAPMRPRGQSPQSAHSLPDPQHQVSGQVDTTLLRSYMADHLTGATVGKQRVDAMAEAFEDTPVYPQISQVAETVAAELWWLSELLQRQDFPRPGAAAAAAWVGERVSRIKPYARRPLKRSPSALVLETELMIAAITAKRQGWEVLTDYADELGVDPSVFADLISAADDQRETLDLVHTYARERAFWKGQETLTPQLKS